MRHLALVSAFLALVGLASAPVSAGTTYSWTGTNSSLWADSANWYPIGLPQAGDVLAFPSLPFGSPKLVQTNDLTAGTVFNSLVFNGFGYQIGGNPVGITGGITASGSVMLNLSVNMGSGDQTLSGPVTFNGAVSGTGMIRSQAAAFPAFGGSASFTGIGGTHPFSGVLKGVVNLNGALFPNASFDLVEGAANPQDNTLQGSGTIGGFVRVSNLQPGVLSVGSLELASTSTIYTPSLAVAINGSEPGTGGGHSQVTATGTVTISPETRLNVTLNSGYAPALGQVFTVVKNNGASAVNGSFYGLPEGSVVTLGVYQFRVSYAGGALGRDVTLTCVLAPNVWTGAVSQAWSDAGNWSAGVPSEGDVLSFPAYPPGSPKLFLSNNLPEGRVYSALVFGGSGYAYGGTRIGLTSGITATNGPVLFIGPIELLGDQSLSGPIAFNGAISGSGRVRGQSGPNPGSGPTFGGGAMFTGPGGAHPFSGVLTGVVNLNGALFPNAAFDLAEGAVNPLDNTLQGSGTVGGSVRVSNLYPGVLNVGSLELASNSIIYTPSLNVTIAGPEPGANGGYSQVNVAGAVTISPATRLNVTLNAGYAPTMGQVFAIVKNNGTFAVNGSFNGLPEGAIITLGVYQFRISYAGGALGRDVTLTCVLAPNVWTGAVSQLWSDAGNWSVGIPNPGDVLNFPNLPVNSPRLLQTNDLPPGRTYSSMVFNGPFYQIGGNAIGLTGGISGSLVTLNMPIDFGSGDQTLSGVTINGGASGSGRLRAFPTVVGFGGMNPFSGVLTGVVNLNGALFPNASFELAEGAANPQDNTLRGSGTIGRSVRISNLQPGVMNVGSLELASNSIIYTPSLSITIAGPEPRASGGYSQVNVAGTVTISPSTRLNVTLSAAYIPTVGDAFVIINNAGSSPVSGQFSGLAEGAVLTLNTVYSFRLSYVGGSGNDVVLVSLNGKNPANINLVSSSNPSALGQSVTFTATVSSATGTPTGNVRFKNGSTVMDTVALAGGMATFTTAELPAGTSTITAQYLGDAINGGSISPPLVQSVSAQGVTNPGPDQQVDLTTTVSGEPISASVVFQTVVSGGQTTLTTTPTAPAPAPDGFQFGNPPVYFDVSTTAAFSGSVLLCFNWTEGQFANEGSIGLWHYEGGRWADVTTELDTMANVVCGAVSSLSPFALMEVKFAFAGFFAPVRNLPDINAVRAGAAVPVKFSLGGNFGLDIFKDGFPASRAIGCVGTSAGGVWDAAGTSGGTSLSYDPATNQYSYIWKTEKAWSGTCRQFVVRFSDGSEQQFNAEFR